MKNSRKFSLSKTSGAQKDKPDSPAYIYPAFLIFPEERIIFKTHPHWLFVVLPELASAVAGVLLFASLVHFLPPELPYSDWLLSILAGGWLFAMAMLFLDWLCTEYYLTNLRLIEQRGIIGKRIMSIWLERVQDVTCSFGILGRIFGFGDIEIESAGTYGKIVFDRLPSPRKLRAEVEKAILELQGRLPRV